MAVDQTEKRRAIARQGVQLAPLFMDALYSIDALRRKRDTGGPNGTPLAFADADFANQSGLTHLDATTINAFFTAIPILINAFGNQNFDEVFEAMRP